VKGRDGSCNSTRSRRREWVGVQPIPWNIAGNELRTMSLDLGKAQTKHAASNLPTTSVGALHDEAFAADRNHQGNFVSPAREPTRHFF